MIKSVNFSLLSDIESCAKNAKIDWKLDARQNGKLIKSRVYLRNQTGNESISQIVLLIDDSNNVAYPLIFAAGQQKFEDVRNKIKDQEGIEELTPAEYEEIHEPGEGNAPRAYKLDNVFKFCNTTITQWTNEIFMHILKLINVQKNIVF